MDGIKLYIKESYNELVNKVTWPSWEQLQSNTILVVIGSLMLAAIIFIMDAIINSVLDVIYGL
ncbi:MAG: preprotein translocase subunit SecE [Bacteroidota bacterium]